MIKAFQTQLSIVADTSCRTYSFMVRAICYLLYKNNDHHHLASTSQQLVVEVRMKPQLQLLVSTRYQLHFTRSTSQSIWYLYQLYLDMFFQLYWLYLHNVPIFLLFMYLIYLLLLLLSQYSTKFWMQQLGIIARGEWICCGTQQHNLNLSLNKQLPILPL